MKHVAGGVRLAVALLAISAARYSKGGESAASPLVAETTFVILVLFPCLLLLAEFALLWWLARVRHRDT
jgi:hypothetical protein